MTSRARLITSIPFWILVAGSVVAGAVGLWIVLDRLGTLERGLVDGTATTAQVYGGQSWSVVGAVLLGTGVVGLFLALAVAAAKTLLPQSDLAVVETVEWASDDDEPDVAEPLFADAMPATTTPAAAAPVASDPAFAEPSGAQPTTSAPVIAEDPDVEVPSTTRAPAAAAEDDKRV